MSIWNAVWAVAFAIIAWITFEFLGRPIRTFFELRREAKRLLLLHPNPLDMPEIELMKNPSPTEAQRAFNEIGAQLIAFDETETLAAWLLRFLGYSPRTAGSTFASLSEWWRHPHTAYDDYRKQIQDVLKFHIQKQPSAGAKPNW